MNLRVLPGGGSWEVELHGCVTAGGARWVCVLTGVLVRSSWRATGLTTRESAGSARPHC